MDLKFLTKQIKKVFGLPMLFFAFLFLGFTLQSNASHFRYGNISWIRNNTTPTKVTFKVSQAWRSSAGYSYVSGSSIVVGSVVNGGTLIFGDNTSATINLKITSVNTTDDWFYGEFTVDHTFPSAALNYTASFTSSARIGTLQNNANGSFSVSSLVKGNVSASPSSTVPPIINMSIGQTYATFSLPATDPNGLALNYSLTPAGSFGTATVQPASATDFFIHPTTGLVSFNTVGKTIGQLFNTSITVTNSAGATTMVDFVMQMVDNQPPPSFTYGTGNTPNNGTIYNVSPGSSAICFPVVASNPATSSGAATTVAVTAVGLPVGASFSTQSGTNPGTRTLCWAPTSSNLGTNVIIFVATNNFGVQVTTSVTIINSVKPTFSPSTPGNNSTYCVIPGFSNTPIGISASNQDINNLVSLSRTSTALSGMSFSPTLPTAYSNPVSTTLNYTAAASDWGIKTLTIKAIDQLSNYTNINYYFVVNNPPIITSTPILKATVGVPYNYNLTAIDINAIYGDKLDLEQASLPAFLTATDLGGGNVRISGIPTAPGLYNIDIEIEDSLNHFNGTHCGLATQSYILEVCANTFSTTNVSICPTELPYSWNGLTFNTAGSQTKTGLQNSQGCDSSATLNLTVKATSTSTTNTSICLSELPYSWNGLTFNAAGSQTYHTTNSVGCDSAATLNLTVNLPPASFSYTTPNSFTAGTAITTLKPQPTSITTLYSTTNMNGIAVDAVGNVYVSANFIYKIATDGTISNPFGYDNYQGIAIDAAGNVYTTLRDIISGSSSDILKIATNGTITTLATGFSSQLQGVAVDAAGNVYVAEFGNIIKMDAYGNNITSIGYGDCVAVNASGNVYIDTYPTTAVALDALGNVYLAKWGISEITKIATDGSISSIGSGFNNITGLAVDAAGNIYVADNNNQLIKKIAPLTGTFTVFPSLPAGLSINTQTGAITGTPAVGAPSANYTVTATNNNGCTATTTVSIEVICIPTTAIINQTACVSYNWHGNTYTTSGSYTFDTLNIAGCDSLTTLNLTILNSTNSSTDSSICPSALPFTWNELTFYEAGSLTAHFTNSQGCDSAATLNLIVKTNTTSTTDTSICPSALPYSWNGLTFNAAGSQTAHLTNSQGCDSAATLNLIIKTNTTSITNTSICPSELPYIWNELTFNTSGSQTAHLTNSQGCDSTATLNLIVKTVTTSTTNISICPSALPFTWNELTFDAAGSQTAHFTNSQGCDSAAILNLIIKTNTTSTTNISICPIALPYNWNGLTFNAAGSQTAHLTNSQGCDSAATLNLIVKTVTTSTANISICPVALPYSWNGLTFNATGSQTAYLKNSQGCDSAATLNLIVKTNTTSLTNTSICPSELPYSWNGLRTLAGTYTFTTINSQGCDSVATLILSVNAKPNAGSDVFMECGTQRLLDSLKATPTGGTWTAMAGNPTGMTLGTSNNGKAIINLPQAPVQGVWSFIYTLPTGCSDTMKYTIAVTGSPAPAVNSGANPICGSNSVQICPTQWGWSNYQWYKNGVAVSGITGTQSCITVDKTGLGTYILLATNGSGCWTSQSNPVVVSMAVAITPTITVQGGNTTACNNANITLISSSASNNQWYKNGVVIVGAISQNYIATASGVYTVTATNCGFTRTSTGTTITIVPPIIIGSIQSTSGTVCTGSTLSLSNATIGGVWTSSNPSKATVNATSGLVTGLSAGSTVITYTITVSGCSNATSYTLNIIDGSNVLTPTISAQSATSLCGTSTVQLCPSVYSWSNYKWYKNGIAITTGGSGACIIIDTAKLGSYTLAGTSGSGCWSLQSNAIAVAKASAPTTPTISASGSTSVCSGGSVTLTSSSSTGNQWKKDGVVITGATNQTYTATASGVYTVTVTVCGSATSVGTTVTVAAPITVAAISASSNPVCLGGVVTMTNSTTGGVWSSSNNAIATISTLGVVTPSSAGTVMISYTKTVGACSAAATLALSVLGVTVATPTLDIRGSVNICGTGSLQICPQASQYSNYQWYKDGVAYSTSSCITVNTAGSYTLTGTNGSGCWSAKSTAAVVTINAIPTMVATTGSTSVCAGSSITLTNSSTIPIGGTGVWTTSYTSQASVGASTGIVAGLNAGNVVIKYTVTSAAGCSNYTNYNVVINSIPSVPSITYAPGTVDPQAGAPTGSFCANRTFTLIGTPSGGVWSKTGPITVTTPAGVVTTGSVAGSGSINYTYTDANRCVNSRTMVGNVYVCAARGITNTNDPLKMSNDFTMYPNPAKSQVNINVETLVGTSNMIVTDLYGKVVKSQTLSMGNNEIDVSRLSTGMYFVSVITGEGKTTKKLIIK